MKKLLLVVVAALGLTSASYGATLAFTLTSTNLQTFVLSSNTVPKNVYSVELTATYPVTVQLFDNNDIRAVASYGTNYVTAAYPYTSTYATNYVTSFVGYNGYTNWSTNVGVWSITLTNAATTNSLPASATFTVAGGTYAVYNTDLIFNRGIVARCTTNVSININYR